MSLALARMTILPTASDTITGIPQKVPPDMVMPGNAGWPSAFIINDSDSALVADISHTPFAGVRLAAMNGANTAWMSRRTLVSSVPLEAMPEALLVMEAGFTSVVPALAGFTKSLSICWLIAPASVSRMVSAADGLEKRAGSWEITAMVASFLYFSVTESSEVAVRGFGAPSPTQFADPPFSWRGTRMLNGTRRRPGIRPTMVCGRSHSMNSVARFVAYTSGAA